MPASSLHRVALSADLDMRQFSSELDRAFSSFEKTVSKTLNGPGLRDAVQGFDRVTEALMKNAKERTYWESSGGASWQKDAAAAEELRRQLEFIGVKFSNLNEGLERLGIQGAKSFDEINHRAALMTLYLNNLRIEEDDVALKARMMGNAGSQAFRNMQREAGAFGIVAGQLGYAIEDFFTVFDTMGVAGGLRAAGNNLAMVARTLIPNVLIANAVAVGFALGPSLWRSLTGSIEKVSEFGNELDKVLNRLSQVHDLQKDATDFKFNMEDIRDFKITPKMDLESLMGSIQEFQDQIKEITRDRIKLQIEVEQNSERKSATVTSLIDSVLGPGWREQTQSAFSDLFNGTELQAKMEEYRKQLELSLTLSPETSAAALETFRAHITKLNEELQTSQYLKTGINDQWGVAEFFGMTEGKHQLEDILGTVDLLLQSKEDLAKFQQEIKKSAEEQAKLEQDLLQTEQERVALAQKKAELEKAAALRKQADAVKGLADAGRSKEKEALDAVLEDQKKLLKMRQEALANVPNQKFAQEVDQNFGAAMKNLLTEAAEKLGHVFDKPIDRLTESFGSANRVKETAANNALVTAMKQIQNVTKDPNTKILQAILDALQNNALVAVPVR